MDWDIDTGGMTLPAHVVKERVIDRIPEKARCPAATFGAYADTGKRYCYCGVERKHFAHEGSPEAVLKWCAGEYVECPVWQAGVDRDPAVEKAR